jgi:hypothetical protein
MPPLPRSLPRRVPAALLLLGACVPKPPPVTDPLPPPPSAGLVEVSGVAAKAAPRDTLLRTLATALVAPCYEGALTRDPHRYGEVVVRFTTVADGSVPEAEVFLSTLADDVAEACVVAAVRALAFPAVTADRLTVIYPFLFTSDATPPEVARALKVRYGLMPADPPGDPTNPKESTPPGVVYLW